MVPTFLTLPAITVTVSSHCLAALYQCICNALNHHASTRPARDCIKPLDHNKPFINSRPSIYYHAGVEVSVLTIQYRSSKLTPNVLMIRHCQTDLRTMEYGQIERTAVATRKCGINFESVPDTLLSKHNICIGCLSLPKIRKTSRCPRGLDFVPDPIVYQHTKFGADVRIFRPDVPWKRNSSWRP